MKRYNFNAQQWLEDINIPYANSGPDISQGWIGIACPFCNDHAMHGGFNLTGGGYYSCWRCGRHSLEDVIIALQGGNYYQAKQTIKQYEIDFINITREEKRTITKRGKIEFPPGTKELEKPHIQYLKKRGFDYKKIIKLWKIKGTGPFGSYKLRIIAPIYYNNRIVSYQGRDITNKQKERYKACMIKNELLHHKFILYGIDYTTLFNNIIIVEGVTDVWRLGPGAVATFGSTWTPEQLNLLLHCDKQRYFTMFDPDKKSQDKAEQLAFELSIAGKNTENILLDNDDPGSLTQQEADKIRKELLQ